MVLIGVWVAITQFNCWNAISSSQTRSIYEFLSSQQQLPSSDRQSSHITSSRLQFPPFTMKAYLKSQHSQECKDPRRQCFCDSQHWLLTSDPKINGFPTFQDSSWNCSTSSLVILAASVFETACGKTDWKIEIRILPPAAWVIKMTQSMCRSRRISIGAARFVIQIDSPICSRWIDTNC